MSKLKFLTFLGLILVFLVLLPSSAVCGTVSLTQIKDSLCQELTHYPPEELLGLDWKDIDANYQDQWLMAVYSELGINPLWVDENGPTEQAKRIFTALKDVEADGLDSNGYEVEEIASLWEMRTATHLARLDIHLTLGLLGYVHDMQKGRLAPKLQNPKLFDRAGGELFHPVTAIAEARNHVDINAYLAGLAPGHRHYQALRKELRQYRKIAAEGGWPGITSGPAIYPGKSDGRIPAVRQLLTITGDLTGAVGTNLELYDDALVDAVKKYQGRHGLKVDGIIGKRTTAALSVPVEKRIRQILLNMERWRWTEHELGRKYVLIDIAGFNLQGVVDNHIQLEMRVIVGKLHHETPVFSDTIKYIEFHPFWNITPSIARNEMLGELRKDSNYLAAKHIRLFSSWQSDAEELDPQSIDWNEVSRKKISRYKLRQDPGPWNALGVVKFVFPNKYSVYLHDTPAQSLFKETDRAFSHGCIRLNKPIQLAQFLLVDSRNEWSQRLIQEVLEKKKRKIIRLHQQIPVHLVYQTVWVDKDEALHFSKDLYGRDKQLGKALFGEE
ncbi:MAG: L,D-transpeptidase family protein [Desulfocapsa sp.]|nr:L,D-transpeptidase family protein [Desulfocapsa sp.]